MFAGVQDGENFSGAGAPFRNAFHHPSDWDIDWMDAGLQSLVENVLENWQLKLRSAMGLFIGK